jgi:hypothetical protein
VPPRRRAHAGGAHSTADFDMPPPRQERSNERANEYRRVISARLGFDDDPRGARGRIDRDAAAQRSAPAAPSVGARAGDEGRGRRAGSAARGATIPVPLGVVGGVA